MKPTTSRIVLYVLSLADCHAITANRARMAELLQTTAGEFGNPVSPGDIVPAVIARAWSDTCINGQALLDGGDTLWLMSRNHDAEKDHGTWHWPAIKPAPGGDSISRMDAELSASPGPGVQINSGMLPCARSNDRLRQPTLIDGLPRRIQLDRITPAESAIRQAIDMVEGLGAHPGLTSVVTTLVAAVVRLADYLETEAPV